MAKGLEIFGLGVDPARDTTLETLDAMESCRLVYSDLPEGLAPRWLKARCRKWLRTADPGEVVRSARVKGPVGLAVWGHPQFASALARQAQRLCRLERVPCRVFASNSPIGYVLSESVTFLCGEEGHKGIQAYELGALLADSASLITRLPLVVFDPRGSPAGWGALGKLLLGRYPADHEARLYPIGSAERRVPLKALPEEGLGAAVVYLAPHLGSAAPFKVGGGPGE